MAILPVSTNAFYRGSRIALAGLALISAGTILPALIHYGLPDGGAGVIAGLDLSQDGATIISLFAWAGATQLVWGLTLFAIALRYRSFIPLALTLLTLERSMHTWTMWAPKAGHMVDGHHPPEAWVTLVSVPVLLVLVFLSLRRT